MNKKIVQFLSHTVLILGVLLMVVPIWIAFATSTHENVTVLKEGMKWGLGDQLVKNYNEVLNQKGVSHKKLLLRKCSSIVSLWHLVLRA